MMRGTIWVFAVALCFLIAGSNSQSPFRFYAEEYIPGTICTLDARICPSTLLLQLFLLTTSKAK